MPRNGVEGLEEVGPERIRELEPNVAGVRGLWSPRTGIIDFRRVALVYADEVRARRDGGHGHTRACRPGYAKRASRDLDGRPIRARGVIACAGLYAIDWPGGAASGTGRASCRSAAITTPRSGGSPAGQWPRVPGP